MAIIRRSKPIDPHALLEIEGALANYLKWPNRILEWDDIDAIIKWAAWLADKNLGNQLELPVEIASRLRMMSRSSSIRGGCEWRAEY